MARTPEDGVKEAVKTLLKERGCIRAGSALKEYPFTPTGWYYMPVQNGMGVTGIPDFVGFRSVKITPEMVGQELPVMMFIETKAPGKIRNTSPNQKQRIFEIDTSGGKVLVADNVDQVKEYLDG